jgi:hypothetical protein
MNSGEYRKLLSLARAELVRLADDHNALTEEQLGDMARVDLAVIARLDDALREEAKDDVINARAVLDALRLSTVQLLDLERGWAHRELFEPLATTVMRNKALLTSNGIDMDV